MLHDHSCLTTSFSIFSLISLSINLKNSPFIKFIQRGDQRNNQWIFWFDSLVTKLDELPVKGKSNSSNSS